jgi:phosphoribosylformylglycinamidine synthase
MAAVKKSDSKVVSYPGDPEMTPAIVEELGLSVSDQEKLERELGRKPSFSELSIAATLWSERCAYRTARSQVRRLPSSGTHVVHGPGENAGVLDIGDGQVVVVRLESRALTSNPQESAAQAVSSVLGDVLAMGGTPVALLDGLRIEKPDSGRSSKVLREAVAGVSELARSSDLPTIGGFAEIETGVGHDLSLLAIGVARRDAVFQGSASGLGSKIIYVGAETFSSLDGDMQKKLGSALQRVLASGSVEGCEDIDAGGLSAAAVDMAARAGTGVELDLDLVPRTDTDAPPARVLTCESPQRFLVIAKRGREESVLALLTQLGIPSATIGTVTNTQRFVCKATSRADGAVKQMVVADMSIPSLTADAPRNERAPKADTRPARKLDAPNQNDIDVERELVRIVGSAAGGGREWIHKQLAAKRDASLLGPGHADAAVITVSAAEGDTSIPKHLAITLDASTRLMEIDARAGAMLLVAECARNIACTGAEPLGLLDAIVLSEHESSNAAHQLSECIEGLREASIALKVPVVGGHVRIAHEGPKVALAVGMIGQLRSPEDKLGIAFRRQADMIALLGSPGTGNLEGSLWLSSHGGSPGTRPLSIDLGAEVKLQRAVVELARERMLSSAHDVSDGGLGLAVAECCVAGKIGCSIELPTAPDVSALAMLLHEEPSRVIVSFPPEHRERVQQRAENLGVPFVLLGFVGGDTMEIEETLDVPVQVLADCHARALDDLTQR